MSESNQKNGRHALKVAASSGNVGGIYFLACIHMSIGYPNNVGEAKKLWALICQKDPRACDALALFFNEGNPTYTGPRIFPR